MAEIVFASLGGAGHTFPLIPLAVALRDAGHVITFATGAELEYAVTAAGLEHHAAASGITAAFTQAMARRDLPERPTTEPDLSEVIGEVFHDVLPRRVYADLLPLLERRRPDLVIAETFAAGAALAARQLEIPCALHSFGRRAESGAGLTGVVSDALAKVAHDLGVPVTAGTWLGHTYLDICPPSLQTERIGDGPPEIPLRPVPWGPPVEFTARRSSPDRPWVYLTLGTAFGTEDMLRTAATGLARLDVDILVATGSADVATLADLRELGPGVQVEAFVPQAELLGGFDLVVHHGGSGTTLAASGVGVPQLFLPQGADQPTNAAAASAIGVGRTLAPDEVSVDAVAHHAAALLADPNRTALDALAAEIAQLPAPAQLAATLTDWAQI